MCQWVSSTDNMRNGQSKVKNKSFFLFFLFAKRPLPCSIFGTLFVSVCGYVSWERNIQIDMQYESEWLSRIPKALWDWDGLNVQLWETNNYILILYVLSHSRYWLIWIGLSIIKLKSFIYKREMLKPNRSFFFLI